MSCNACANFMNVRSQNGCLYLDDYIDGGYIRSETTQFLAAHL